MDPLDELAEVRRLLQAEKAKREELELELARVNSERIEDLLSLLRVTGMGDHARPQSPAEVFAEVLANLDARLRR